MFGKIHSTWRKQGTRIKPLSKVKADATGRTRTDRLLENDAETRDVKSLR
jgi:hypothetical protein